VRLIDTSRVLRNVTLDIDSDELAALVATPGSALPANVVVPLALLPKTLLLDLDISDATDRALSLVVSDHDATAAQAAILCLIGSHGVDVSTFSQDLLDNVYRICHTHPSTQDLRELTTGGHVPLWRLDPGSSADAALWEDLFHYPRFVEILETFTRSYMPMVSIPTGGGLRLIKYRHLERQVPPQKQALRARLSLDAYTQIYQTPAVGRCGREHLRFEAPEGLFLEDIYLRDEPADTAQVRPDQPHDLPRPATTGRATGRVRTRITPERGVVYTRGLPQRKEPYAVVAVLRPPVCTTCSARPHRGLTWRGSPTAHSATSTWSCRAAGRWKVCPGSPPGMTAVG